MATVGVHCILELYGCDAELLNDPARLEALLKQASTDANATYLTGCLHRFDPQGVTALGLLSESHISIHTWPELGYAAADIFTCGDQCDPEVACETLIAALSPESTHLRRLSRGPLAPHHVNGASPAPEEETCLTPQPTSASG